ncbi:MAG: hypothetical protein ACKPKO_35685 [Candidatus Fonsibacter sp.]
MAIMLSMMMMITAATTTAIWTHMFSTPWFPVQIRLEFTNCFLAATLEN